MAPWRVAQPLIIGRQKMAIRREARNVRVLIFFLFLIRVIDWLESPCTGGSSTTRGAAAVGTAFVDGWGGADIRLAWLFFLMVFI